MIYDYHDQEGYVSIWIGNCKDNDVLREYMSTVYLDDDEDFDDGLHPPKRLEKIFLPANKDRACEEELREDFNNELYNQFEYDFGLTFDEDFMEADVYDSAPGSIEELLTGFSFCTSFMEGAKKLENVHLPECNAALVLYNFKYTGGIPEAEHEGVHLYFLGYAEYDEKAY
ncbi:MAG: immunity 22 family protein [Acetatifactor sp.]|nr:immunity 22 family protein [Acetatifactor sp.]